MRISTSGEPPGADGMMKRIGFSGYAAWAENASAGPAASCRGKMRVRRMCSTSVAPAAELRRYARAMRATFVLLLLIVAACSYFQDPSQEEATIVKPGNFTVGSGVIDSVGVLT